LQEAREAATALIEAASEQGLEAAAEAAGMQTSLSEPVRREDTALGIEGIPERRAGALVGSLFSLTEPGEVYATPLAVEDSYVVMALAEEQGPFEPGLDEVRDRVAADLRLERGREQVREKLASVAQALADGKSFSEAADTVEATVQTADSLKPGQGLPGMPESSELVDQAFASSADTVIGPQEVGGRQVILRVKSKFEFDEQRFEQEKDQLADSLRQQQATVLWSSLVRGLRERLESRGELRILRSADFFSEQRSS
jgi:peptidyl-prolyl cis-trans isomerase D